MLLVRHRFTRKRPMGLKCFSCVLEPNSRQPPFISPSSPPISFRKKISSRKIGAIIRSADEVECNLNVVFSALRPKTISSSYTCKQCPDHHQPFLSRNRLFELVLAPFRCSTCSIHMMSASGYKHASLKYCVLCAASSFHSCDNGFKANSQH